MRIRSTALAAASALLLAPSLASSQGLGVAGRAGTLGLGVEGALALSPSFTLRGGVGLLPIEFDASNFWDIGENVVADFQLPDTWFNIGADLHLGPVFRIGGGMLYKPDDPTVTASLTGAATIDIAGQPYTADQLSEVVGTLESDHQAPYVIIGFGKHTQTGVGLFLDLGVAFTGTPTVRLEATKGSMKDDPFVRSRLDIEEQELQEEIPGWVEYYPILNAGVRIGLGN